MNQQYSFIQFKKPVLLLVTCFLLAVFSLKAQTCPNTWSYININPANGYPCSPGWTTLRAEVSWTDPTVTNGEFRWYASETSTDILYSSPCYNDGDISEYSLYASEGQSVFVCIYNYYTGCETNREQYYFSFPTSPSGYIEYARDCGFGVTQIKAVNTSPFGVGFELVKMNNYGNWEGITNNYDGNFEVPNLNSNPNDYYAIRLNAGGYCGASALLPFSIDYSESTAPTITGNTTICEGTTTTLTANGPQYNFYWYDPWGNVVSESWMFQTPANLTQTTRYTVRGGNSSGCLSNPTDVLVSVNPKPVDGTITASATTICLGQTVELHTEGGRDTPHWWGSSNGGQSWNIFDNAYAGNFYVYYTPTAVGTYRFHVRYHTVCGYCWEQPGGCPTFPYVDVTVVDPSTVTVSVSTPAFGQGDVTLTPSFTGSSYQWQYDGADIPGATNRTYAAGKTGNYRVIVTSSSGCGSTSPQVFVAVSNNNNYIITNNIRKPGVTTNDQVDALGAADNNQHIVYIDGLGRTMQEVGTQGSPGNQDVVAITTYDAANRVTKEYLPYTGGNDGSFKTNAIISQANFYQNLKGDGLAFAETRFDNSPANRILEKGSPGAAWQLGTGHTQQMSYRKNTWGEVRIWNYDPATQSATSTAAYNDNELYVTETINPQGQKSLEFKDKSGLVLCSKVQKIPGDDNSYLLSYNVYDDLQNLRYTISPEAVNNLPSVNYTFSYNDAFTKTWLRSFNYDERSRITTKRSPGAEEEYIVYDSRDRIVFTQDANLRGKGLWHATLYDEWNRIVITARVNSTAGLSAMQNDINTITSDSYVNDPSIKPDWLLSQLTSGIYRATNSITLNAGFESESNKEFVAEIVSAADTRQIAIIDGVAVYKNPLPVGAQYEILTVAYYDDYNWVANSSTSLSSTIDATYLNNSSYFITTNTSPVYAQAISANYHVRGKMTGGKIKVLGSSNQYLHSVSFYDNEGQVIQVQSINQTGGKDIITNQYDYSGNVLRSLQQHQKLGTPVQTNMVLTRKEYNRNNKLEKVYVKTGSDPDHLIVSHTYNEIGELQQKVLGNNLETLDYAYNIQGWLTTVNKGFLQAADNAVPTRWFGMELAYDNTGSVVPNTSYSNPRFNGNVTGSLWRTRGSGVKRKFEYAYDNLNRLIASGFKQQFGSVWDNTDPNNQSFNIDFSEGGKGNSDQFIEYDDNGNIKNAWRKGLKVNSSSLIDNLTYGYTGNKLDKVTDLQSDPNTKLGDFHDGGNIGNDYLYDGNGSLTKDENKGISTISYNHLDLPEVITILNKGTITYTYDAAGNKLKKVIVDNSTAGKTITTTTTYFGGVVYESRTVTNPGPDEIPDYNDKLQSITHDEGRIRWVPASSGSGGSFVYDFFVLDQTGNVRVILTEEQKTNPYPMASMEDVPDKNDLNNPDNYIPYYANADYTSNAGVRYPISSIGGYPTTGDVNATPVNNYVAKLNGNGNKIGQSMVLKVMAGDQFNVRASSWYKMNGASPDVPVNPLLDLVSILATSAGNIPGSKVSSLDLQNSGFLGPNIEKFLTNKTVQNDRPKAYLNWVFLDDQFQYVQSGSSFEQVPLESYFNNSTATPKVKWLGTNGIAAAKNGYLYVYVSNETPNIDVFFDNLQVTHVRGPLLEESHYYPMGMEMAGICSRASMEAFTRNKNKYQGQEYEDALGLNMHEFEARQYDPQIGRWVVQDPVVNGHSPYSAMGNNPMSFIDPDGRNPLVIAAIIGALNGAYSGYQMAQSKGYDLSDGKAWGYILGAAVISAGASYAGAEISQGGGFMSNTMGMMFTSAGNAIGMVILSGGTSRPSLSFGAASLDLTTGKFNYLGKKGNSFMEDFGYAMGALANIQDIMAGVHGTEVEVKARRAVGGHSQTEGNYETVDEKGYPITKRIIISVGPHDQSLGVGNGVKWEMAYVKRSLQWNSVVGENEDYINTNPWSTPPLTTKLTNVNGKTLARFTERLQSVKNLNGGDLKYGLLKGCVNYNARALFRAGVVNFNALLPVTSPLLLNAELALRQIGIYASPYLINYRRQ